jgi:hypothetical protein
MRGANPEEDCIFSYHSPASTLDSPFPLPSAADGRTAFRFRRQRARKRVEGIFCWIKTIGEYRKTRFRGVDYVGWGFTLAMDAYNMLRIRNLTAQPSA